jgi:hypothetical protein
VSVLGTCLTHRVEQGGKVAHLHPFAVLEAKDERLGVGANVVLFDLHVIGVEVGSAYRDVHAEFADVVEWLLALQAVFAAALKLAVVQLDGAQRFVLGKLIARNHFDYFGVVVVTRLLHKFVDGVQFRGLKPIASDKLSLWFLHQLSST